MMDASRLSDTQVRRSLATSDGTSSSGASATSSGDRVPLVARIQEEEDRQYQEEHRARAQGVGGGGDTAPENLSLELGSEHRSQRSYPSYRQPSIRASTPSQSPGGSVVGVVDRHSSLTRLSPLDRTAPQHQHQYARPSAADAGVARRGDVWSLQLEERLTHLVDVRSGVVDLDAVREKHRRNSRGSRRGGGAPVDNRDASYASFGGFRRRSPAAAAAAAASPPLPARGGGHDVAQQQQQQLHHHDPYTALPQPTLQQQVSRDQLVALRSLLCVSGGGGSGSAARGVISPGHGGGGGGGGGALAEGLQLLQALQGGGGSGGAAKRRRSRRRGGSSGEGSSRPSSPSTSASSSLSESRSSPSSSSRSSSDAGVGHRRRHHRHSHRRGVGSRSAKWRQQSRRERKTRESKAKWYDDVINGMAYQNMMQSQGYGGGGGGGAQHMNLIANEVSQQYSALQQQNQSMITEFRAIIEKEKQAQQKQSDVQMQQYASEIASLKEIAVVTASAKSVETEAKLQRMEDALRSQRDEAEKSIAALQEEARRAKQDLEAVKEEAVKVQQQQHQHERTLPLQGGGVNAPGGGGGGGGGVSVPVFDPRAIQQQQQQRQAPRRGKPRRSFFGKLLSCGRPQPERDAAVEQAVPVGGGRRATAPQALAVQQPQQQQQVQQELPAQQQSRPPVVAQAVPAAVPAVAEPVAAAEAPAAVQARPSASSAAAVSDSDDDDSDTSTRRGPVEDSASSDSDSTEVMPTRQQQQQQAQQPKKPKQKSKPDPQPAQEEAGPPPAQNKDDRKKQEKEDKKKKKAEDEERKKKDKQKKKKKGKNKGGSESSDDDTTTEETGTASPPAKEKKKSGGISFGKVFGLTKGRGGKKQSQFKKKEPGSQEGRFIVMMTEDTCLGCIAKICETLSGRIGHGNEWCYAFLGTDSEDIPSGDVLETLRHVCGEGPAPRERFNEKHAAALLELCRFYGGYPLGSAALAKIVKKKGKITREEVTKSLDEGRAAALSLVLDHLNTALASAETARRRICNTYVEALFDTAGDSRDLAQGFVLAASKQKGPPLGRTFPTPQAPPPPPSIM